MVRLYLWCNSKSMSVKEIREGTNEVASGSSSGRGAGFYFEVDVDEVATFLLVFLCEREWTMRRSMKAKRANGETEGGEGKKKRARQRKKKGPANEA
jgi:hypothetical protein